MVDVMEYPVFIEFPAPSAFPLKSQLFHHSSGGGITGHTAAAHPYKSQSPKSEIQDGGRSFCRHAAAPPLGMDKIGQHAGILPGIDIHNPTVPQISACFSLKHTEFKTGPVPAGIFQKSKPPFYPLAGKIFGDRIGSGINLRAGNYLPYGVPIGRLIGPEKKAGCGKDTALSRR